MTVSIYAIKNPLTNLVFYVGASCKPQHRFREHYYGGTWRKDTERAKIMHGLMLQRIMPDLIILAEVKQVLAKDTEQFWMDHYKALGHPINQSKSGYPLKHSDDFIRGQELKQRLRQQSWDRTIRYLETKPWG